MVPLLHRAAIIIYTFTSHQNVATYCLMKGKGTKDAIFIVRQTQENFRVKGNKLYLGFMDLEKAFDRVLREVIRCQSVTKTT